jgi:hypothetical protein
MREVFSMQRISIIIFALWATMGCAVAAESERVDWVIYLATTPYSYKSISNNYSNDDIGKHAFPLYIGYVYSKDSKSVQWYSVDGIAERKMKSFALDYPKYKLVSDVAILPSKRMTWTLDEYEFFDALVILMASKTGMYPVRYERNAIIDQDWRPVYEKEYRYTKEDIDSYRVKTLLWLPKPKNWDQDAYNERMKK